MRSILALLFLAFAAPVFAQHILVVPLDNRPASGQYAEIIGKIGGADVLTPPLRLFGNYTIAGQPDAILDWMDQQDLGSLDALVVSSDMLLYGSLFESRKYKTTVEQATARLNRFLAIRRKATHARCYVFSSIMRLTPSATHDESAYRMALAQYVVMRSSHGDPKTLRTLRAQIPAGALEDYDAARRRNLAMQMTLLKQPGIDYLVFGQDDASAAGPQVAERRELQSAIQSQSATRARICEGVDQVSSLLVSRALLTRTGRKTSVRVVYSDVAASNRIAMFESQPISKTVVDQIETSGARLAWPGVDPDYTLFVNVPGRAHAPFLSFLTNLESTVDGGGNAAVADANVSPETAAPDPELYGSISDKGRPLKLLAYSAWNTAANTIGTSVAASNTYLLSKGSGNVSCEVAQKQFMLYRMANDFAYHTMTRPVAYAMTDGPRQPAIFGKDFYEVNDFVQRDLSKFLKKAFYDGFLGRQFKIGDKSFEFYGITDLSVSLPWPRPYEVRLEFDLEARPAD